MRARIVITVLSILLGSVAMAAVPPPLMHYQGVLRDTAGNPVDGTFDMIFRFYDAETGGTLLYSDEHLASGTGGVTVSGGLLGIALGSGTAGPGAVGTLERTFKFHDAVYLEVEIAGETLSPRTRVVSSGYALNAGNLDGLDSEAFANRYASNTFLAPQTFSTENENDPGIVVQGVELQESDLQEWRDYTGAKLGSVSASGVFTGSGAGLTGVNATSLNGLDSNQFLNTSATPQTKNGKLTLISSGFGVESYGGSGGGFFQDVNSSGHAYLGYGDFGISAWGNTLGGQFADANSSGRANVAVGDWGIEAFGRAGGGLFRDSDGTGYAYLGYGDTGIEGHGNWAGGYFKDRNASGEAWLGYDQNGIVAFGSYAGGFFRDIDSSAMASVAIGDTGIEASGAAIGARFWNTSSGSIAYIGRGGRGIEAYSDGDAVAYFENSGGDYVTIGDPLADATILTNGRLTAGSIRTGGGSFTLVSVVRDDDSHAGVFRNVLSGNEANLAGNLSAISVHGAISSYQNAPNDKERSVSHSALGGDEVGTYTRGTARLVDGQAQVTLGETFAWVTNPDIGLTAHLTPHGRPVSLAVESLTTSELVVRGPAGEDVVFDYVVHGLRIGYEEHAVVSEKREAAPIPSMRAQLELYERHPELRRFNALERFTAMREAAGLPAADLSASSALREAIGVHVPAAPGEGETAAASVEETVGGDPLAAPGDGPQDKSTESLATRPPRRSDPGRADSGRFARDDEGNVYGESFRSEKRELASVAEVSEPVEVGDVLVADPEVPGALRLARIASDPAVVGIVSGEAGVALGSAGSAADLQTRAPVAVTGFALCRVDAGYGAIRVGDLLTASPTPGHAMRSPDAAPGTIVAKALEPLAAGSGSIRVLVMLR